LRRVALEGKPEFEDRLRLAFVGLQAPSIDGVITFQGEAATLRELHGRVVLLEFWASWCGICRYLAPTLNRLQRQHRPAGLTVLGITLDPPERGRAAAVRTKSMDYALASDSGGRITRRYLASQVPTVFVIDPKGVVVDVMVGVAEDRVQELVGLVEELLRASRL
jgi:peroxiredoxin